MKRLRFMAQALQDFQDIHDRIALDNSDLALGFINRLEARCIELCEMPNIGRKRDDLSVGMRSSSVGDYLIFYRVKGNHLEVVHIVHGRRDLPRLFDAD